MKSKLFNLDWKDLAKGFIMAVLGALVAAVYQAIQTGGITFTWGFWQPIIYTSIGAGLAYLLKNWLTGEDDKFLKK